MADSVDPALSALIADPRMALRRPPPSLALADLRRGANAFLAGVPRPPVAMVRDIIGEVPLRLYRPTAAPVLPVILFLHGGGFVLGNLDTHDAMCRTLALEAQAAVIAVDYRLAPEHPHPAALNDTKAAVRQVVAQAEELGLDTTRVAVAGDSAGGHLAVAIALTSAMPLRHLGLFYPLVDPAAADGSMVAFNTGYMLTRSFVDWAWESYAAPADLVTADLSRLPPMTVVTAACDPLRDQGEAFAARAAAAGVAVQVRRYAGMIHGFAGLPHITPLAGDAIRLVGTEMRTALAA